MLAQGWGLPTVYGLVAIPAVIAGAAILVLGVSYTTERTMRIDQ